MSAALGMVGMGPAVSVAAGEAGMGEAFGPDGPTAGSLSQLLGFNNPVVRGLDYLGKSSVGLATPGLAGTALGFGLGKGGAFSGEGANVSPGSMGAPGQGANAVASGMGSAGGGATRTLPDGSQIVGRNTLGLYRVQRPNGDWVNMDENEIALEMYKAGQPLSALSQNTGTAFGGNATNTTTSGGSPSGATGMATNDYMSQALGFLKGQSAQARKDLAPWMAPEFLDEYASAVREGPGEFTESPGYQFTLGEGMKAIERAAAARGQLQSPATQKALAGYATNLASQEYDSFLNRYYQSLAPKADLAGRSLQATLGLQGVQVPVAQSSAGVLGQYGSQAFQGEQAALDRNLTREVGEDTRRSQYDLMEEQSKSNFWGGIASSAVNAGALALASSLLG